MKSPRTIILLLAVLFLASCMEQGSIVVKNKVSNARLESISFGDYAVYGSLMPGESSEKLVIKEFKDAFPFTSQLEFYMTAAGNTVYLKTLESYSLDYGQDLIIEINDSTAVINPVLE